MWDITDLTASLSEGTFSCCIERYSQAVYEFTLKRHPDFFLLYLILPCVALVALTLLSFLIPPESGERIGFGITVILSFSVYLIVISDKLPEKSDKKPLLGQLYVSIFYTLVTSFIAGTINVRLAYNSTRPPQWLLSLVQGSWRKCERKMPKIEAFDVKKRGDKEASVNDGVVVMDETPLASTKDEEGLYDSLSCFALPCLSCTWLSSED